MKLTPQQSAIHAAVASGESLVVDALAGTGKTTTSVSALSAAPGPSTLCCAFNKRIQLELESRLPGTDCRTMNGLGHRALMRQIGKVKLSTNKLFEIAKEVITYGEGPKMSEVLDLVRAAQVNGLVPAEERLAVRLLPDEPEVWSDLADEHDIVPTPDLIAAARQVLRRAISVARSGTIDFQDQIYMSVLFGAPFQQYDRVLIDEAQDLDPLQHRMIRKLLRRGGQLIVVGDPHQAIYAFRGALCDSMDRLVQDFNIGQRLPLSISFRCPQRVIAEAQSVVPEIQAWTEAPEGLVGDFPLDARLSDIPDGAILCRFNAPLFSLAMRLISQRIPCAMQGRDIGRGLERLIQSLAPERLPIRDFLARLQIWLHQQIERKPAREMRFRDRALSIEALADGVRDSAELLSVINKLFSEKNPRITLSSIHRAKGLEWPNVLYLDRGQLPNRELSPEQSQQEQNLIYVALTRAQRTLQFADSRRL